MDVGKSSKSVQAVEWYNRKEAWTTDHHDEEVPVDSGRNNQHQNESQTQLRFTLQNQKPAEQDDREQVYIRDGNADILRLITRESAQQHPNLFPTNDHYNTVHSGKDIIMQHFIEQQTNRPEYIPNSQNHLQTDREIIQESLREQNALLRQLLIDRDLRLETQSLPACTQTDHDKSTQIEPQDFYLPKRETQTDNEQNDESDEDIAIIRAKARKRNGRKSYIQKRIRTPIEEEMELKRSFEEDFTEEPLRFKHTKTSELRQKRASSQKKLNELQSSKLGLKKEVLEEISESLEFNKRNGFKVGGPQKMQNSSSEDSSQLTSYENSRYFSESDLSKVSNLSTRGVWPKKRYKSETNINSVVKSKPRRNKKKKQGISRYMEWYKPNKIKENTTADNIYVDNKNISTVYKYPEEGLTYAHSNGNGLSNDSGRVLPRQSIAHKKSIFTIAYNDMLTKQIRPDSTLSQ